MRHRNHESGTSRSHTHLRDAHGIASMCGLAALARPLAGVLATGTTVRLAAAVPIRGTW